MLAIDHHAHNCEMNANRSFSCLGAWTYPQIMMTPLLSGEFITTRNCQWTQRTSKDNVPKKEHLPEKDDVPQHIPETTPRALLGHYRLVPDSKFPGDHTGPLEGTIGTIIVTNMGRLWGLYPLVRVSGQYSSFEMPSIDKDVQDPSRKLRAVRASRAGTVAILIGRYAIVSCSEPYSGHAATQLKTYCSIPGTHIQEFLVLVIKVTEL